ncbi:hypothetical protein [Alcaligenes aquatilis]|uniref:hypothetical protein n=1 Tax=Alcaligenes aquatilis TaxID=323284 RepID=UPI00361C1905
MREQRVPKGDFRYRVHKSKKVYVGELRCGSLWCTWYFDDSIERVVHVDSKNEEFVVYKWGYYKIRSKEDMLKIIKEHIKTGGGVNVGGVSVLSSRNKFEAFEFIDITEKSEYERMEVLRPIWMEYRKNNDV